MPNEEDRTFGKGGMGYYIGVQYRRSIREKKGSSKGR